MEQVQELQRDNSAQQSKILMSAFGNTSVGDSGLGSLLGAPASNANSDEQNEGQQQVERTTQLEREVSTLTNENLKLKEQNAELQQQLEDNIGM